MYEHFGLSAVLRQSRKCLKLPEFGKSSLRNLQENTEDRFSRLCRGGVGVSACGGLPTCEKLQEARSTCAEPGAPQGRCNNKIIGIVVGEGVGEWGKEEGHVLKIQCLWNKARQ